MGSLVSLALRRGLWRHSWLPPGSWLRPGSLARQSFLSSYDLFDFQVSAQSNKSRALGDRKVLCTHVLFACIVIVSRRRHGLCRCALARVRTREACCVLLVCIGAAWSRASCSPCARARRMVAPSMLVYSYVCIFVHCAFVRVRRARLWCRGSCAVSCSKEYLINKEHDTPNHNTYEHDAH